MDYKEFSNFLNDRMRERGLNIKRLSELSGISIKNLELIFSGNSERLPSAPYLKGYIFKLGEILDFDPDEVWDRMKKSAGGKNEEVDELPKNRFSRESYLKYMVAGTIIFLLVVYGFSRFYKISGTPFLDISYPRDNMAVVSENPISISGRASNTDELKMNGESVQIQQDGQWKKEVFLQAGINTIEITAKKFLGREIKITRQIIYQPAANTSPAGAQ